MSLGEGREECDELFWSPVPFMAMGVKEPKNPRYTLFVWGKKILFCTNHVVSLKHSALKLKM